LLITLIILACNGGVLAATATPVPTNSPVPTNTDVPTPIPTETPLPTATLVPTPASVGESVRSASYEVTVLGAKELKRVYMGDYYYSPLAGQIFVEVVVKVSNLTGSEAKVPWKYIYVKEESGDIWYSNWAGFKAANTGKKVDSAAIGVNDTKDGTGTVDFQEDVYLRMIWFLTNKDKTVLFGFDDSPQIQIVIE
jgi:hypothetical protein